MSMLGNYLLRSIQSKNICSSLRLRLNAAQIKPRCFSTVTTHKDVVPRAESEPKLNNAAKLFMERSREYDEMIQVAGAEYRIGMRHLANMMGVDPETFTQADADEAIEYLFPSALNDKKARPFMKPPQEVFPPRKKVQFDQTGRPFHYMFFTNFPNFYEMCHQTVEHMRNVDKIQDKEIRENKEPNEGLQLNLEDSEWLSKDELQNKIIEDITDRQYEDYVNMMNRLLAHPYSYHAKRFIMEYRKKLNLGIKGREIIEPKIGEDGRKYVTTYECKFKSARAEVTVISPGTGKIEINGKDINYFQIVQPKETCEHCLLKRLK